MLQSLFTSIVLKVLGWAMGWISRMYKRVQRMESERDRKSKEAFEKMVEFFSELLMPRNTGSANLSKLTEMSRQMAVWAPDEVLVHYTAFLEQRCPNIMKSIKDHEIEFGKTILAFRRERGFRNKDDKLNPRQIVAIFKAGWDRPM
jgi:hypothetical protein